MRKTILNLTIILLYALSVPASAQNVLDNLRLADKMDIYFESSRFNLTDDANSQLNQVVAKFRQNSSLKIRITAHTDGQGNQQANYILSDKRANSVKYFFLGQGIPPEALVASTFGKDKPTADNDTENGRKMNRRASIEVYEPAPEMVKEVVRIVEKPVIQIQTVEKIVEKQVIVEKPVVQIQTVEKIVEKPVVVEKQVIVEKPVVQIQTVEKVVEKPAVQQPASFETMFERTGESSKKTVVESPKIAMDGKPYLQGVVQNRDSKTGIPATIFVKHLSGKVDSIDTENDGTYRLLCAFDEIVTMDVYARGYFYNSQDVVIKPNQAQKIDLQPLQVGSVATITNLYFVGNEATLLKSSDTEMAKILRFMRLNEDITIEIAGHVNAPGVEPKKLPKEEFNISTRRATAIRNFLIHNGFSKEKITGKGYGNSQMKYPEPTTERQEELNRRVEIKVLGVN
jgi:outer membrane protein OmpA-like peptidoglycan-associated protein